jgi:hypothetical protein
MLCNIMNILPNMTGGNKVDDCKKSLSAIAEIADDGFNKFDVYVML